MSEKIVTLNEELIWVHLGAFRRIRVRLCLMSDKTRLHVSLENKLTCVSYCGIPLLFRHSCACQSGANEGNNPQEDVIMHRYVFKATTQSERNNERVARNDG